MQIELKIEYYTQWGENLFLVSAGKRFSMFYTNGGVWCIRVDAGALYCKDSTLHFHFEVERDGVVERTEWNGHSILLSALYEGIVLCIGWSDAPRISQTASFPSFLHCDSVSPLTELNHSQRFAGTAVPLFSLRSESGFGCGEFNDLKLLVNWIAATGQKIIQLLPVNDTSSGLELKEVCPYNAVSAFALHPIFINLEDAVSRFCRAGDDMRGMVGGDKIGMDGGDMCGVGDMDGSGSRGSLHSNDSLESNEWFDRTLRMLGSSERFSELKHRLNSHRQVNYEEVFRWKIALLEEIFKESGDNVIGSEPFRQFCAANEYWLEDYSGMQAKCCIGTSVGEKSQLKGCVGQYASVGMDVDMDMEKGIEKDMELEIYYSKFIKFIQYIAHCQFKDAVEYAHSKGVCLKGDLPIGVSRNSADALAHPELFNLATQAGAPPDAFSATGQMWGFPTYNWDSMEAEKFKWWRGRLRHMSQYFSFYRIDHILGFFRIWEIPLNAADGTEGYFNPSLALVQDDIDTLFSTAGNLFSKAEKEKLFTELFVRDGRRWHPKISPDIEMKMSLLCDKFREKYLGIYYNYFYGRNDFFWKQQAIKRLPALLGASSMIACGEDLGMIPSTVPEVMKELNILSLEVQRMPKRGGEAFAHPKEYSYMSVCTTGTHDMSTLRGWWKENHEHTQLFYNQELGFEGEAPAELTPSIASAIVSMHLASASMLAIFPIQDWMALTPSLHSHNSERINNPADSSGSWRYRMSVSLEELLGNEKLNIQISELVSFSGRQ